MTDSAIDTVQNPMEFFRLRSTETKSRASAGNMTRAIDSLSGFVGGAEMDFDSFDETLLGEWVAYQLFHGYYTKTIAYNMSKIAALYNKAVETGLAKPNGAFAAIISRLNDPSASRFDGVNYKDVFQKLQSVIRADFFSRPQRQLAKDLLLFSIYAGGMTFDQLAAYKKDDYTGDNEHIAAIVGRYSKARNKYLFPLRQAHSTPRQVARTIEAMLNGLLSDYGIRLSGLPSQTSVDLWCAAAMNCGISTSDISACVASTGAVNAFTAFAVPSDINDERVAEIRRRVIATLTDNPVRWYAMHFRRYVDYDMVAERLRERGINLVDVYYPMEEMVRKIGHRKVFENRPVISWLLFFREHEAGLSRLYHEIGDLAWGYRQSREVNSRYAVISPAEINRYKIAIGTFGNDTELYHEGEVDLQPGDRLVVIGGLLNGRPATFDSMSSPGDEGGKTVCRILLDGGRYRDWIVKQDIRLVKKISEEQFDGLRKHNQEPVL